MQRMDVPWSSKIWTKNHFCQHVSHASVSAQNAKVPSQQVCPMLFHQCVDYDSTAPRYLALDIVSTCIMG